MARYMLKTNNQHASMFDLKLRNKCRFKYNISGTLTLRIDYFEDFNILVNTNTTKLYSTVHIFGT